ncbi:28s ribosomal protein [Lynx pardinus]|uniref:Small ribosomal subunit protein mS26 n=1 Tax=Lynx pardinus TaxID=191816 RepID=A0A485P652_LYNPA|nr:28s ribosomal protein [Lynx pardinus]
MADCRLGLLLLLLPTAHPGRSKAQHWSQGWYPRGKRASSSAQHSQHVPRLPGSSAWCRHCWLARLRQEAREQEQRQAEEKARRAREAQAWTQLKEQEALQLQEEAKNFITRENLEARVEEALDSPKSYNWAITREGLVVRPQHKGS